MFRYFHRFFVALNCTFWQILECAVIYTYFLWRWIETTEYQLYQLPRYISIVMCSTTVLWLIPCLAWSRPLWDSSGLGQARTRVKLILVKLVFGSSSCSARAHLFRIHTITNISSACSIIDSLSKNEKKNRKKISFLWYFFWGIARNNKIYYSRFSYSLWNSNLGTMLKMLEK